LNLTDVVLVGNSIGGWIACEMALRHSPRISGIILINAVGIDPNAISSVIVDPMSVSPTERAALAFHNPKEFMIVPSSPQEIALIGNNQKAVRAYAGEPYMHDPSLQTRLNDITVPTMVIWGESDAIVTQEYGRHFASSIPDASFMLVQKAGHFPQIEQPDVVLSLIDDFLDKNGLKID
jgi:pimeloyl-ACP methyl ester carboxylesterase